MFINHLVTSVLYLYNYIYLKTLLCYLIQHGNEFRDYERAKKLDCRHIKKATSSLTLVS